MPNLSVIPAQAGTQGQQHRCCRPGLAFRGNGGLTAENATDVDATIWEAGIAALAPNLVIILLGTNDHSHDVDPADFSTQITTTSVRSL